MDSSAYGIYTLDDLSEVIFPDYGEATFFSVLFSGYLDDSKDRGAQKFMTSAGFVAQPHVWRRFRRDWERVLASHDLRYFKSSECFSVTRQFAKFKKGKYATPAERAAAQGVRAELETVLQNHRGIRGIGVVVQLDEYRAVVGLPGALDVLPADPYRAALSSVIFETVKYLRRIARFPKVAFVHDDQANFDDLRHCYRAFKGMNPDTAHYLKGFQPLDDKETYELQAADLVANHATFLAGQRPELRAVQLEMRANISHLGVWNKAYLAAVLKNGFAKKGLPIPIEAIQEKESNIEV